MSSKRPLPSAFSFPDQNSCKFFTTPARATRTTCFKLTTVLIFREKNKSAPSSPVQHCTLWRVQIINSFWNRSGPHGGLYSISFHSWLFTLSARVGGHKALTSRKGCNKIYSCCRIIVCVSEYWLKYKEWRKSSPRQEGKDVQVEVQLQSYSTR